jgi:Helix-loop-helix DNA-binding domain
MSLPNADTTIYAASCNPARRAKRLRSESISESAPNVSFPKLQPRAHDTNTGTFAPAPTSVPLLDSGSDTSPSAWDVAAVTADTQKRGRKTTSRAAREAQRKLNHSMIEKVRRTKINDALAKLRALVPIDYGHVQARDDNDNDHNDDEAGGDGDSGDVRRKKTRGNKKDEKEKEYKLEILVRTVAFVQDLVEKVKVMEAEQNKNLCAKCGGASSATVPSPPSSSSSSPQCERPRKTSARHGCPTSEVARLPSISSWLLPSPSHSHSQRYSDWNTYHLPSPPSSALVDPVKTTQLPPTLTLDLPSGAHKPSPTLFGPFIPKSPLRTPEDESAASLLLQISNSPPSLPHHPAIEPPSATNLTPNTVSGFDSGPDDGQKFTPHLQAQTPSSLLGLDRRRRNS